MIKVKNITKTYGNIEALKDVSLEVKNSEFISIVGPSGSGKTTLLNVIAGLLTPTEGEVIVNGVSLYKLSLKQRIAFRRKNFGFIFQTFNLLSYLTAIENVEIPLYLAGAKSADQKLVAKELLDKVGLKQRLSHLPSELSIGEQQRVAIARALANKASVLLADEPTGNLDTKTGKAFMREIKRLNGEGVTVLLVTHNVEMAKLANRQIEMTDGRLMP